MESKKRGADLKRKGKKWEERKEEKNKDNRRRIKILYKLKLLYITEGFILRICNHHEM